MKIRLISELSGYTQFHSPGISFLELIWPQRAHNRLSTRPASG